MNLSAVSDPFLSSFLLYAGLVLTVIAGMLVLPSLLGERHARKAARRNERGTDQPYESGIQPTGSAHLRLPIQYYLMAMLFVAFDMEAVYLYAWAVVAREAGWTGFVMVTVFIGVLLVALVYLWREGALDVGQERQARMKGPTDLRKEDRRELVA